MSSAQANFREGCRQYRFGSFILDLDAGLLRCDDEEIALRPKSFEVLTYLVERHGRLVSSEELMSAVWPGLAVTDEAVTKCIGDIRRAVRDDAQQLVRTVARRGYIFTAAITSPVEFRRHAGGEIGPTPKSPLRPTPEIATQKTANPGRLKWRGRRL